MTQRFTAFHRWSEVCSRHIYTPSCSIAPPHSDSFKPFLSFLVSFAKSDMPPSHSFSHIPALWLIVCLTVATSTLAVEFPTRRGLDFPFNTLASSIFFTDETMRKVIAHFLPLSVWMWCSTGTANRCHGGLIAFSLFKRDLLIKKLPSSALRET